MHVILAHDGSVCADAAISELGSAGIPPASTVTVLTVAEFSLPIAGAVDGHALPELPIVSDQVTTLVERALQNAHDLSVQAADRASRRYPDFVFRHLHVLGSPAQVIIEQAELRNADLVVVGSHGRGALGRLFMGSISLQVLRGAPCAVRVVKRDHSDATPLRILVAVDGSSDSDRMIEAVAKRSWPAESEFRILHVEDLVTLAAIHGVSISHDVEFDERTYAGAADCIHVAEQTLRQAKLNVHAVRKLGSPKDAILDEALQWGATTIFLGARGKGRIERLLLGSVSQAVAARAEATVEVVR